MEDDRAQELRAHIDDASEAGEPLGLSEATSVFGIAAHTQMKRAIGQLPIIIAGLPVLLLCFIAYGFIYESHFAPWDLMEETPSTNPTAATLRQVVDRGWMLLLPLGLVSGWRVATSVRRGRIALPIAYLVGIIILISLADLFIERTAWFGRDLQPSHVNIISPYSIGLISASVALPAAFLVLDAFVRRRTRSIDAELAPIERNLDTVAIAAVVSPLLFVVISTLAVPLFWLLTWAAPTFRLRHKLAATLATGVPLITALLLVGRDEGIDDPGLGFLGFVIFFIGVWAWLASAVFRG